MKNYTAEDVRDILTAFVEEYLVDVPAKHDDEGYWIEFFDLTSQVIMAGDDWFAEIADHANYKANWENLAG